MLLYMLRYSSAVRLPKESGMAPSRLLPVKSSSFRMVNSEMKDGTVPERPVEVIVIPRRLFPVDSTEGGNSQVPSLKTKVIYSSEGIVNNEDGIVPPKSGPPKRIAIEFRFTKLPIVDGIDPTNPF